MGQQDCKDLFICLAENRKHWTDVNELFEFETESFTTCSICQNVSSPNQSVTKRIFLQFECPEENIPMSCFIECKLNFSEVVSDWRDEEGCKRTLQLGQ